MTAADALLASNREYRDRYPGEASGRPTRRVAVVACMDSRLDVFALLGLRVGEANVLRNAGGVVTDDMLRSLAISQRKMGTREIVLVHHTDCGMTKITDDGFDDELFAASGARPQWKAQSFRSPEASVRESIRRILESPFLPHKDVVRGFVFEVATGALSEVAAA